jgi:hypothetical protein
MAKELPSFDGLDIAAQVNCMCDGELDAFSFDMVEIDQRFAVVRCDLIQMGSQAADGSGDWP